jgi:hypothetical protein
MLLDDRLDFPQIIAAARLQLWRTFLLLGACHGLLEHLET